MSGPGATAALFRCDGAPVPRALAGRGWDVEAEIAAHGPRGNLNLRVEELAAKVAGGFGPRAVDLIHLAAYCYAADQMVARGGPRDVHRAGWRRRMALCVPVADPRFWADPATAERLAAVLGFLTEDAWEFAFAEAARPRQMPLGLPLPPLRGAPDAVVLFSGGTDSLCGLVEAVAAGGGRPVVVSHRPAPHIDARQKGLLAEVRGRYPGWPFPQLSFWVNRAGSDPADSAQRTRAFLFAALGAAAADAAGVAPVALPDNGYVSLNPPISAQLVGALASRGTHPTFLRLVNGLFELVFPTGVRVHNPLGERTRAEALGVLAASGCPELLQGTLSCGKHRGRPKDQPHCGGCSQCVDRRFAAVAAGLEAHDRGEGYGLDVFTADLPPGEPRAVAEAYVRFAQATERMDADALFAAHPELAACLDPDDPRIGEAALGLAGLLERHGGEVLGVLAAMVRRHSGALARRALPDRCLLRLALGAAGTDIPRRPAGEEVARPGPAAGADEGQVGPARPRHRLERYGKSWFVTFRAEKGVVDHSVGMERLARLLKAPGQSLDALDLVVSSGPGKEQRRRHRAEEDGAEDPDALTVAGPGRLGPQTDRAGLEALKEQARQLEEQFAAAQAPEEEGERARIRARLEALADQVQAHTGKRGRPRPVPDEHERARQTVRHTVDRALAAIGDHLPGLRAHLDESLHLGLSCRYDPRPPEAWAVVFQPSH